jgi:hypothetical protein
VQACSGVDVACLRVWMPADSWVTPEPFPKPEERDDVHHEPANRANSMTAAVVAESDRLASQIDHPVIRNGLTEQSCAPGIRWSSSHDLRRE